VRNTGIDWSPGSERPRWETPRLLGGYNVRSVRIPGIVKELAASDVEEIPKLVTEDLVGLIRLPLASYLSINWLLTMAPMLQKGASTDKTPIMSSEIFIQIKHFTKSRPRSASVESAIKP
jgi:hypothetical protein